MTDLDELDAIASNWQRPEDVLETERRQVEAVVLALPALLQEVRAARAAVAESGRLREALRRALVKAIMAHPTGRLNDREILAAFDAATPPAPSDHGALDVERLARAARRLVRAYDANVDALNGDGHPGEEHDRFLHHGPRGDVEIFDLVGDCAGCGGAQYGSEDTVQVAIVATKLALGEPLRPYEEVNRESAVEYARLATPSVPPEEGT